MTTGMQPKERLMSIDVLRGFDMLLIIFADHFFRNLHLGVKSPITEFLAIQFEHPEWLGFHIYDVIMPLFLFVVGAVIPFSMVKRIREAKSKSELYPHLIRRIIILFILGWIVQGNLLHFDIGEFRVFSNTLQAIAVGYFFSVLAFLYLSKKGRYILFVLCLILYAMILALPNVPGIGNSELLPDKNYAIFFDRLIMGRFDDGNQYTWLLTGLGFTATTLAGLFGGELLRAKLPKLKILKYLVLLGFAFIALGLIWDIWHPIIKKLWTSSFVLFIGGICYLLLALFYWIVDIKGYRKWSLPLNVIGMNAITAYVLSHIFNFPKVADQILFGLEKYMGDYYPMMTSIGGFGILYLILWYMYKNKTFVKI
jgi:predicted acyltransferase